MKVLTTVVPGDLGALGGPLLEGEGGGGEGARGALQLRNDARNR